jgi:hypothetical protein
MEQLASRTMMSATLSGGALTIAGTNAADSIKVSIS